MKKKLIAILCAVAMLIPMAVMPASAWTEYDWTAKSAPSDIDYSFAVIGDMQQWTYMDTDQAAIDKINATYGKNFTATYTTNEGYLSSVFDWLLQEKSTRKIEYVFGLGDTINRLATFPTASEAPDNKDYYANIRNPMEWSYASQQISRLNSEIPYLIARGNHDDEAGYETYITTNAYKADKGFFCEETNTPSDVYGNSLGNAYQKIEIKGYKYIMMSLDYNASDAAIAWANEVIAQNPEYRVIIAIHAYLNGNGSFMVDDNFKHNGEDNQNDGDKHHDMIEFRGEKLWNEIFRKHANILAVLSGHVVTDMPCVQNTREGDKGNKVLEIVVDPSNAVTTTNNANFVMMLNFREDTNEIEIEYLSPSRAMSTDSTKNSTYHVSNFYNNVTTQVSYRDAADWESITRNLGLHVYVGAPMTTSPTLNGVIDNREYSYSKYFAPDDLIDYDSVMLDGGVTEYIAHDENYVYYAISLKEKPIAPDDTKTPKDLSLQWQFNPLNYFGIFNDKTSYKSTLFERVNWQLQCTDTGLNIVENPKWNYSTYYFATLPKIGTDLLYAATKTDDDVKTYEIALSKDYLATYNNCTKEEIKVIPYMTHQHGTSTIAHNYTDDDVETLKDYGATRAETGSAPLFMVLDESPDAIQNTIKPTTKDGASARISTENPGLRFKTKINKVELDALITKYGLDNVSVGILIAPSDKLGNDPLALTHAFGEVNVDFVDVKVSTTDDMDNPIDFRLNVFPDEDDAATNYTFAGSLANIKIKNLGREFVGRGYISYVDFNGKTNYIYAETACTRSIDTVATAALKDTGRYSKAQIDILEKLTVAYYNDPFKEDPFYVAEN